MSVINTGLFRLPVSPGVNLGGLCLSINLSTHLSCRTYWHSLFIVCPSGVFIIFWPWANGTSLLPMASRVIFLSYLINMTQGVSTSVFSKKELVPLWIFSIVFLFFHLTDICSDFYYFLSSAYILFAVPYFLWFLMVESEIIHRRTFPLIYVFNTINVLQPLL